MSDAIVKNLDFSSDARKKVYAGIENSLRLLALL